MKNLIEENSKFLCGICGCECDSYVYDEDKDADVGECCAMEKIQSILEEEPETPEERDQREEDEHENYLLSDQYDDDCKYEKWDWLKNECG